MLKISAGALSARAMFQDFKWKERNYGRGRKSLYTIWKTVDWRRVPFVDDSPPNSRQQYRALVRNTAKTKASRKYGSTKFWRREFVGVPA